MASVRPRARGRSGSFGMIADRYGQQWTADLLRTWFGEASFRPRLPDGSADTDRHYVSGPVFGLKTVGGGALMFYGLTARLSLAPPPGGTFELAIPGYDSPSQTLTSATVIYVDQFATYIPRGPATPRVVADASRVAG